MPVVGGTQYAQRQDLDQLGILPEALATVDNATKDAALLAASALADSQLTSSYVLPLINWGRDLVRAVCIIAAYDLITNRGYDVLSGADSNIRSRYLDQLAWLQEVSQGKASVSYAVDSSAVTQPSSGGTAADGSVITTTNGGLQMVTSTVRGWTSRGGGSFDPGRSW